MGLYLIIFPGKLFAVECKGLSAQRWLLLIIGWVQDFFFYWPTMPSVIQLHHTNSRKWRGFIWPNGGFICFQMGPGTSYIAGKYLLEGAEAYYAYTCFHEIKRPCKALSRRRQQFVIGRIHLENNYLILPTKNTLPASAWWKRFCFKSAWPGGKPHELFLLNGPSQSKHNSFGVCRTMLTKKLGKSHSFYPTFRAIKLSAVD